MILHSQAQDEGVTHPMMIHLQTEEVPKLLVLQPTSKIFHKVKYKEEAEKAEDFHFWLRNLRGWFSLQY